MTNGAYIVIGDKYIDKPYDSTCSIKDFAEENRDNFKSFLTDDNLQSLIDKMQYKSENIKARFEPSVFADVVNALKELQGFRKRN